MGTVGVHPILGMDHHDAPFHGTLHAQSTRAYRGEVLVWYQGQIPDSADIQKRPLSARHGAQGFTDNTSFIPHNNDHFPDGQTEAQQKEVAELSSNSGSLGAACVKCPPGSPGHLPTHLRLEVLVYKDVIAVQLEAVLVTDDHLLNALQAFDEDVVHVAEECLHCLGPVLGRQVLSEALEHPLAALRWEREPQLTGTWPDGPSNNYHQQGPQFWTREAQP